MTGSLIALKRKRKSSFFKSVRIKAKLLKEIKKDKDKNENVTVDQFGQKNESKSKIVRFVKTLEKDLQNLDL